VNAKPKPLIVSAVVSDGKVRIVDDFGYRVRSKKAAEAWGEGTALSIRIEPEGDAKKYGQLKWWYGYVVRPLVEYTGDAEWPLYLKAMFMPEDKTSLTELGYDEMKTFSEESEAWARVACLEAYEQCGRECAG